MKMTRKEKKNRRANKNKIKQKYKSIRKVGTSNPHRPEACPITGGAK